MFRAVLFALCLGLCTPGLADEAAAWKARGDAAFARDEHDAARSAYERALAAAQAEGDLETAAGIRHQLAFSYLALGRAEEALALFLENLEYNLRRGRPHWAAPNFLYAAEILVDRGRFQDAVTLLARYPAAADEDPERRARVHRLQVIALEALGRTETAHALLHRLREQLPPPLWERHLAAAEARLHPAPADPLWRWGLPALALPLLLALWRPLRRRHGHWLLLAFSSVVALMGAELLARQLWPDPGAVRHFLNPPHTVWRFRPAPGVMPGIDYEVSRFTVDDVGLRGDDLADARGPRILVVGGSSVEALFVDDADAWPGVAQRRLQALGHRLWIGNAGKSGLESFAHRIQIHHALRELRPRTIVVQAGINDLNRCISGGRARLMEDARRARRPDFYDHRPGLYALILPPRTPDLALARLLLARPQPPTAHEGVPQDAAGLYLVEQRRRRAQAAKVDRLPAIDDCLAVYRDNLEAMVAATRAAGVRLALLTQGSLYRPDLPEAQRRLLWFGSVDAGFFAPQPPRRYYSVAVMAELLGRYNQTLLAVCTAHRLPCLDVDALLPKSTESYYDDVHLNRQGSRRLGERLATFLLEADLL